MGLRGIWGVLFVGWLGAQAFALTLVAPGKDDAALLVPGSLSGVLRHGVADFQEDAREALGRELPTVRTPENPRRALVIVGVAGQSEVLERLAEAGKIDLGDLKGRWESYVVAPVKQPFPEVEEALVIAGSDDRGALYGLYEVSESVFGTDPLKFWTDHVPPRLEEASWRRGRVFQGEPSFRFRGFYVNDENYLMSWKGKHDDIEPELWAEIFETILRLRGNVCSQVDYAKPMLPETLALLDERGLYLTGSHLDILLSSPMAGWKAYAEQIGAPDLAYSFTRNPEQVKAFWQTGVAKHAGRRVLWPIGLRWTDDRDFFESDPGAPADWPSRGRVVNDAVAAEMKILREASPADQPPVVVFSMRGQAHLKAFQDGHLHLPEDAINLYNDRGSTARFLTRPTPEDLRRHKNNGVYFHLTYCDNQWVQWVSPALIEEELTKAVDDGMTRMAILNVGDIREIPLSLSAGMAFLYNDQPWIAKDDYASAYTKKWCRFQYGDEAGPAIARLLEDYFLLEYPTRASTVIESFQGPLLGLLPKVFKNWQDRTLMDAAEAASGNAEQLARDLGGYDPAQEGLASRFGQLGAPYLESVQDHWSDLENRAEALSAKVPASAKDFYYFSVTLQIKSSRLANQFGLSMYRAIEAVKNQRFAEAAAGFEQAAQQIMAFQTIRDAADHGKWKDWHKGEHIVGWNGIPWGTTSSWSVHSERVAGALRRLAEICRAQVAETASTAPAA